MAQHFNSVECRILADGLGRRKDKYICNKYVGTAECLWLVQHIFDDIPCRILAFTDTKEFERFYKLQKNKFKYEKQQKQFPVVGSLYNGAEVNF